MKLRKELNLFANIRPCFFPGQSLLEHSPLKPSVIEGVQFTVVRELTGGIYFGDRMECDANGFGTLTTVALIFSLGPDGILG